MHYIGYGFWLLGQVLLGAWDVARNVLTPGQCYCPIVVSYPLRVRSDALITAFATSITMTPGTMSLGLRDPDEDGRPRTLLVQAVFGQDPDAVMAGLRDMEQRLCPAVKEQKQ